MLKPIFLRRWFNSLKNATYIDVSKLNTSSVTDMGYMFYFAGYNATSFEIIPASNDA